MKEKRDRIDDRFWEAILFGSAIIPALIIFIIWLNT